ncbi:ATP-dependent RecD-like DNA helicase [Aliarcobacter butzleri]|uniref:ATP-dependent DNA helicase n=1 Tax=Aliarcobacter butzleri TaxID=28197 RepID=UPI000DB299BC|nr:ATP-dependent RecD-like DNA helicase [Aliarcobacter butzleri]MCT7595783.1 ATP-dependent RecD-like DNA helicase [Aliarcobacter butzleri]PZQ07312.1 MAG: helicase [Aliarcobacter butzleri]
MQKIDIAIITINQVIDKNIDNYNSDRGFLSQNIMSQLRNFVEHVSLKAYSNGQDIEVEYENINKALVYVSSTAKFKFLNKFHKFLQPVASHYTLDEENSERLMLKYYEYLLKIKAYLKKAFNLDVLENINKFPINNDSTTKEYYEKIAKKINQLRVKNPDNERYYIHKIKPFFINQEVYYEVTFIRANDYSSKFDRIIAFTKLDILSNYAIKLHICTENIDVLGKSMPINIIDNWEVSIRPCELNNFNKIFGMFPKIQSGNKEYQNLMTFLTQTSLNLVELLEFDDMNYNIIRNKITSELKLVNLFNILDRCRILIKNNLSGNNVIKYLLYKLNNKIIKSQYSFENCKYLSNLKLDWGCIPFDQMPFTTSLKNHNPKSYDLFDSINPTNREHELFARFIKNNIEVKGELFTLKSDIINFTNIDDLIKTYNSKLYLPKHNHRKLEEYKSFIYIRGYEEDTIDIIKILKELSCKGIKNYSNSVISWLQTAKHNIDCDDKKTSLIQMFENSTVALIYGSAGTGKSTIINHISNFFNERKKLYLTITNPAIDNLKRKVYASNCDYKTIAKFLAERRASTDYDLLIIDECSMISNADMLKILNKATFKLLVLVGDVFQIESINFGNWFNIVQNFIPKNSTTELTKPYRSSNKKLLELWKKVRNIDEDILEHITRNGYSVKLDESIFENFEDDEIILCLNYDGLYGINNINKFLQSNNVNKPIKWGDHIYKVNDPILFNETKRFGPSIYNNLKGKIIEIKLFEDMIQFDIEIDKTINAIDTDFYDFELIENSVNVNSIIRFKVNMYKNTDEDDDSSDAVVPFQVAYAVSIHKAQGLEYDSVKIVISNEVEEMISHNIFYTAITRAKEKLKIYWSPEVENKILNNLEKRNNKRDVALLTSKMDS